MIKLFTLVMFVTLIVGCATQLKTKSKSEWFEQTTCNVEVELSDGAKLCSRVEPIFPREALLKGLSGRVTVSFDVDSHGKAKNLKIKKSHPKRTFDKAAREAVRKWLFIPKFENDMPIEDIGLSFTLTFSNRGGANINISKEDWLKNLHSILLTRNCDKLSTQSFHSCQEKLSENFGHCVKYERDLDSIDTIESLDFASKLGNKITSCVVNKSDSSGK